MFYVNKLVLYMNINIIVREIVYPNINSNWGKDLDDWGFVLHDPAMFLSANKSISGSPSYY